MIDRRRKTFVLENHLETELAHSMGYVSNTRALQRSD